MYTKQGLNFNFKGRVIECENGHAVVIVIGEKERVYLFTEESKFSAIQFIQEQAEKEISKLEGKLNDE